MYFSCNRQRLVDVLSLLAEAIPSSDLNPLLKNVLLEPSGPEGEHRLLLSATDNEMAISHRLETGVLSEGEKVLLPAQRFLSMLRDDRSEEVDITVTGHVAKIKTEAFKHTLVGQPADQFPALPEKPADGWVELSGADVADAVAKTQFATAQAGDSRYALNGILVSIDGDRCEFVSSDTHRLSCVGKNLRNPGKVKADCIVFTKGLAALARMAAGRDTVSLRLTETRFLASTDDGFLAVGLVAGQFPRYREVIPAKLERRVAVRREELAYRLRILSVMADPVSKVLHLESSGENLLVVSAGGEAGDGRTEMEATVRGGSVKVAFNCQYLLDVLKALSEEEQVAIQISDSNRPSRIDVGDFTHVIMPTQL